MSDPAPRLLAFCPYLPLRKSVTFSRWTIAPLSESQFADEDFANAAKQFLSRFADGLGRHIRNPSLIFPAGQPITGASPDRSDLVALDTALRFAAYEPTKRFDSDDHNRAHGVGTADHGELFLWPLDTKLKYVTISRGSLLLSESAGGWRYDDEDLQIPAPLELILPDGGLSLDAPVIEAIERVSRISEDATDPRHERAKQVKGAIDWCNKAHLNSNRFTMDDRIVMLKVAFEALTNEENSMKQASALESMLHTNLANETIHAEDHLLWQPNDPTRFTRHWVDRKHGKQHADPVDPFTHWYMAFSDVRNGIIHTGRSPVTLVYSEPGSLFNGHHFWIGEWMLRTSIKVALIEFGASGLWRDPAQRLWQSLRANAKRLIGA